MAKKPKEKPQPSKPRYITVQIIGASEDNPGLIHEGWYISIGGEVALVDRNGKALRDKHARFFLQQLRAGDNEIAVAKRLLKRHYYSTDKPDGYQPIRYPKALDYVA